MYLLDTNVISELRKKKPHGGVMVGRPDQVLEDAMLAATERVDRITLVTRNTCDLKPFGVPLFNPSGSSR